MTSPVDIFARGARDGVYPGAQLAASCEGEWLVDAAVGDLGPNLGPTHEQVVYDLASLTKPLGTTLLVARAVEQGLCTFEDPINRFVPGVDPELRIEHLLEHAAGYPAHLRFDRRLPEGLPQGTWDAWRHIVFDAAKTPRERKVNEAAVYSDIGFILLGAALEVMFARPLPLALGQLDTPLFYRDVRGPPSLPPVRPRWPIAPTEDGLCGFVHDENARAMGGVAGHAGLWGNAEGVLRVAEMLVRAYHGHRGGPLSPDTVRRMWQPSLVPGSTRTLGWDRPSPRGSSTGGRWPEHAVGHLGFTGTSLWIEPDRALIVVLVSNRVCPTRANNTIRRLRPALYDAAWSAWGKSIKKVKPMRAAGGSKGKLRAHSRTLFQPRPTAPHDGDLEELVESGPTDRAPSPKRARTAAPRGKAGVRKTPAPDGPTLRIDTSARGDGPTKPSVRAHPKKPRRKRA